MSYLKLLKAERRKLDKAISVLEGTKATRKTRKAGKRTMSASARKRISEAAKARWAAIRKQTKAA